MIYGGSIEGVFHKVALQVPELGLTLAMFKEIHERWLAAHPAYQIWRERIIREVTETRTVRTANGRTRYFLGDMNSAIRAGLDTPIQGTANEYWADAVIRLRARRDAESLDARLVTATHDSVGFEVLRSERDRFAKVMKEEMERPQHLWNRNVSFPVELKWSSKSWGEMEKLEVKTSARKSA
jgi:DNA polymerase I-like protein with 3'-5' exonuclease and polymerase domains